MVAERHLPDDGPALGRRGHRAQVLLPAGEIGLGDVLLVPERVGLVEHVLRVAGVAVGDVVEDQVVRRGSRGGGRHAAGRRERSGEVALGGAVQRGAGVAADVGAGRPVAHVEPELDIGGIPVPEVQQREVEAPPGVGVAGDVGVAAAGHRRPQQVRVVAGAGAVAVAVGGGVEHRLLGVPGQVGLHLHDGSAAVPGDAADGG